MVYSARYEPIVNWTWKPREPIVWSYPASQASQQDGSESISYLIWQLAVDAHAAKLPLELLELLTSRVQLVDVTPKGVY